MKLTWIDEEERSIVVVLEEDESLGLLSGPITATVPTDPANVDYAAIQTGVADGSIVIEPYVKDTPNG